MSLHGSSGHVSCFSDPSIARDKVSVGDGCTAGISGIAASFPIFPCSIEDIADSEVSAGDGKLDRLCIVDNIGIARPPDATLSFTGSGHKSKPLLSLSRLKIRSIPPTSSITTQSTTAWGLLLAPLLLLLERDERCR